MTWQVVDTAPADVDVQLGWVDWHSKQWAQKVGFAKCTKGGWLDGQATHWQPLPAPPIDVVQS
jgi:hypothetical protein